MRGNYKTIKNNSDWRTGTAYIVETRAHPNLPLVLKNADQCLPDEWSIVIFCGSENYQFVDQILSQFTIRNIQFIELKQPIKSLKDYNDLLFSTRFWQNFETENLLGFQVDSMINPTQKAKLAEITQYDYVGAPWSKAIQRRWDYIPDFGGNGGICFSKRSTRLAALEHATYPRVTGEPHHQILNEDIWFSWAIKELNFSLSDRNTAANFFVESVPTSQPFAVHKPWCYLTNNDYQMLVEQMPDLAKLKIGCEQKPPSNDPDEYRRFLLRFARACLNEDNFYQADLALQVCQSRFPNDVVAYNLQSTLAYRLGLYEQASIFVNKALSYQPGFKKALENKVIIDNKIEQQNASGTNNNSYEKYLLIHSWGSGLGFDLLYLLKQLMIAELTNRKPMVYWGHNSLYNDHPQSDCFTDYFEPISNLTFNNIEPYHKDCYPKFWQERSLDDYIRRTRWRNTVNQQNYNMTGLYYLNREETLVVGGEFTSIKTLLPWIPNSHRFSSMSVADIYRDLINKYIRPKTYLQQRANQFVEQAFSEHAFIAIHLRGTDKKHEKQSNDIAEINRKLIEQVAELDQSLPIFVMTDDVRQISIMQQRFGERIQSVDVTRSDNDELGVHHTASDKQKIAQEVIVDMLIAAQSDYFFGCGFSYLACCVQALKTKESHTCLLPFDVMTRFNDIPIVGRFGIE